MHWKVFAYCSLDITNCVCNIKACKKSLRIGTESRPETALINFSMANAALTRGKRLVGGDVFFRVNTVFCEPGWKALRHSSQQHRPGLTTFIISKYLSDSACFATVSYIFFLLLLGNGLVILAVVINKKLRSATNALIVSLAFADLPVGLVIFPLISLTQIYGPNLHYGKQLCNTTIFFTEVFLSASCLHLLFISLDRYLGEKAKNTKLTCWTLY